MLYSADFNSLDYNFHGKKIIIVPSVIISLYGPPQNHLSTEERYRQTVDQLKSIRLYYPEVVTILAESSRQLSSEMQTELEKLCDIYVSFSDDQTAMLYAHEAQNKNKNEIYVLKFLIPHIRKFSPTHICKFGGRYSFTGRGDIFSSKPVFKVRKCDDSEFYSGITVEPVFYSIPYEYLERFYNALEKMHEHILEHYTDNEHMLHDFFVRYIEVDSPPNFYITGIGACSMTVNIF